MVHTLLESVFLCVQLFSLVLMCESTNGYTAYVDITSCTYPNISGCTILNSKASCVSSKKLDLSQIVDSLPVCVTSLQWRAPPRAGLDKEFYWIYIYQVNFARLTNIRAISLDPYNMSSYEMTQIGFFNRDSFCALSKLEVLQIRIRNHDRWSPQCKPERMKNLSVLDLTRNDLNNLNTFTTFGHSFMKKLILKNVQNYMGSQLIDLTALLCPVGKTLEHVDLSFNFIYVLQFPRNNLSCMLRLRYFDISYNMLTNIIDDDRFPIPWALVIFLYNAESLNFLGQWYNQNDWNKNVWIGDKDIDELLSYIEQERQDQRQDYTENPNCIMLKVIENYLPHLTNEIKIYICKYLEMLLTNCDRELLVSLHCIYKVLKDKHEKLLDYDSLCDAIKCLAQDKHNLGSNCRTEFLSKFQFMHQVLHNRCGFEECVFGLPIPFFPNLEYLYFSSRYSNPLSVKRIFSNMVANKTDSVCFYNKTRLKILEVEGFESSANYSTSSAFSKLKIQGLKKLESFNIAQNFIPKMQKGMIEDMPSLRQLNLSFNSMSTNGMISSDFFATNTKLKLIDLASTNLSVIHKDTFVDLSLLEKLNLSSNKMHFIDINVYSTNLTEIILSDNKLQTIGNEMMKQLELLSNDHPISIDLSNNQLSCDCSNIGFIHWLYRNKDNIDFKSLDKYSCYSSKSRATLALIDHINNLKAMEYECAWYQRLIVYSVSGTLGGLLLLGLPILVYKKRWTIRRYLYIARERLILTRAKSELKDHYDFDAFIIYSNEEPDRIWVHFKLLKTLEDEYKFKLCIHHRDFLGGIDIADNIEDAIRRSRKVIAILSPDFLTSRWCNLEVQMTDTIDPNKLIFVSFRNIPVGVDIPTHVSILLETKTYIEWANSVDAKKVFWKRMVKALYHKRLGPATQGSTKVNGKCHNAEINMTTKV